LSALELVDLTKTFAARRVVDGMNLTVPAGELLVIVGPSGCGKTTTLRMIAGLESPDSGDVRVGGRSLVGTSPRHRDVSMVFQDYALYPHMTVRQNLAFGLKMRQLPPAEIDQRVAAATATLGLAEWLDRKPDTLSGGQRQRVAIGRAIVRQPDIFLLDEPLSNLDAQLRDAMRVEWVRLHRQLGATMIYVTHDQTEAMMIGQRVAVMDAGRIRQIDTPLQLYHHPNHKAVAAFFGSPSMNFFTAQRQPDGGWWTGSHRWPIASDVSEPVVEVGVRPEAFTTVATSDDALPMDIVVDVAQPLGAVTHVHGSWQNVAVTVLVTDDQPPTPGTRLRRFVAPGAIHMFCQTSGQRIGGNASHGDFAHPAS